MRVARITPLERELSLRWMHAPPADPGRRVVATGVFDLLHVGHVRFLKQARAAGTSLIVGVESDERVRARKGAGRPIVPADERCEILAELRPVDGVFLIEGPADLWTPEAYARILEELRPAALALTEGDPAEAGKRSAARSVGAEIVVVPLVEHRSTTALLETGVARLASAAYRGGR